MNQMRDEVLGETSPCLSAFFIEELNNQIRHGDAFPSRPFEAYTMGQLLVAFVQILPVVSWIDRVVMLGLIASAIVSNSFLLKVGLHWPQLPSSVLGCGLEKL